MVFRDCNLPASGACSVLADLGEILALSSGSLHVVVVLVSVVSGCFWTQGCTERRGSNL